ncbi:ATP-binding protein [Ponticaulis profundi]|uniref:histidine kinase n=1 Tax=Ponticaulis profundi TaxID=2665222 RepID=A0ABW1S4N2_9PROT
MTDTPDPMIEPSIAKHAPDNDTVPESGGLDMFQAVFWLSLLIAVIAACVAIVRPDAVGQTGPVLLIAMASGGMVFLVWILRGAGKRLGLFPARGAVEEVAARRKTPFAWINALDEAVIVTEKGGGAVSSNDAYTALTNELGVVTETERAVTVDRLFGANPGLNAPIYRLSRAAKAGESRREVLPAIAIGDDNVPAQFEVAVSPLDHERTLWRLRRLSGMSEAMGAADSRALFVEEAPIGFFITRANGQISYANSWLRNFLGLSDELVDVKVEDILRPESVKIFRRDKKQSGQPVWLDLHIRARDGVENVVKTATTWTGKGADSVARTIVLSPVNAPKLGNERLTAASSARPEKTDHDPMFDDAPFGVARLEGESLSEACIVDANRSLVELTEGKATPGAKFADLFKCDSDDRDMQEVLLSAVDHPVELQTQTKPQRDVTLVVTLDSAGKPNLAYAMDMTEQMQLKNRLIHSEKMQAIGTLAGGVAHDFNNMLTGVMLHTDKLLERHTVGDPSFDELQQIHELSSRSAELVKMLLAFSRQQTFKREILNVSNVLNELNYLIRPLLDERVVLRMHHGRDLPMIRADKGQLENAIINLATNARDAMIEKGGGELTISTSRVTSEDAHDNGFEYVDEGEYLCVEVRDNGSGMPPEVIENIFEPFFTTKEQGKGTGLGLATVYGIVKQSGGYICPKSKVGEGTSFFIYLPALKAEELDAVRDVPANDVEEKVKAPRDLAGRGRIMLVEDEDGVRNIAATLLRNRGYDVIEAADGEEALDLIIENQGEIDLLISDVILPGIDGPSLLKQAREYLGDARVMFISGYSEGDLTKTLDEERAISFLPKPFRMEKLAERVKEELSAA